MFTTQITPRMSETNRAGHISNTVLPVWFEAGRAEIYAMFRHSDHVQSSPLVIKTFTVTFHRELELSGEVTIECAVTRVGRTSFALAERALQHGQVCATGEVVYVVVGPDGSEAVPDAIRDQLNAHQISESAPEH
ncbi:acyl-CoA thioesterase [Micrococcus terreus]|uniref:Acyl-CoA thioester hydrolase n=1 Tax=Micrococcus terreus TaxID=574650 RepID=A0A1I7MMR4_9MICC|nr:thioesterase family protein [Micrococcus terreus]SFV23225.1 acyl-CoA thioester hydrolase [Micrococcus terreus]